MKNLKNTFVVLFNVNGFDDSRKYAESIENKVYQILVIIEDIHDVIIIADKVRLGIIEELEIPISKQKYITVYPITEFMDLFNNQEINEDGTFMSYVHGKMVDEIKTVVEKPVKKMSKKALKELASHHLYKGYGVRTNVFYFDWLETSKRRGFKYAVASDTENTTKAELFDVLYNWVVNEVQPPYYVRYKFAETDEKRFKVGISLNF